MCEEPWFDFQNGGKASPWPSGRSAPNRTDPPRESSRATAPPVGEPSSTAPHFSPCRFTDHPNGNFPATKSEVDSELQQLLSFLQKRNNNEGEGVSKRRRRDQGMSHYPDDKRMAGYQWDWTARGPFCSGPQGWGPMGMPPMPHAPPGSYYPTHMMPAHAHSHMNQWNPAAKIQHAHSQPKPTPLESPIPPTPHVGRPQQGTVDLSAHCDPIRMRPLMDPIEKPVQLTKPRSELKVPLVTESVVSAPAHPVAEKKTGEEPPPALEVHKENRDEIAPPIAPPLLLPSEKDRVISSTREEEEKEEDRGPLLAEAPGTPLQDEPPLTVPPVETETVKNNPEPTPVDSPSPAKVNEKPDEVPNVSCSEVSSEVSDTSPPKSVPTVTCSEPTPVDVTCSEPAEEPTAEPVAVAKPAEDPVVSCSEATCQPTVSSTSTDVKPPVKDVRKKKKKVIKKRPKSKTKVVETAKAKVVKQAKPVERKGPVLQITGPRDTPLTVTILNGPRNEDDDEKRPAARNSRPLEHRGRTRHGLFSCTLSTRYDAVRPDPNWICVFCKLGSHGRGLGDLFGPYVITREQQEELCEFSGDERDIVDTQKRGGRTKKSIRANQLLDHFKTISRKLKRRKPSDSGESMTGILAMSDDESEAARYEVWTHEMCAVWSPGVCLVDTGLLGLQDAVWHCYQAMCSKCGLFGANIGCIHRNCPNRSHYACAVEAGWSLPLDTFISTCHFHVQRS